MDDNLSSPALQKRLCAMEGLFLDLLEFLDMENRHEWLQRYALVWSDHRLYGAERSDVG